MRKLVERTGQKEAQKQDYNDNLSSIWRLLLFKNISL